MNVVVAVFLVTLDFSMQDGYDRLFLFIGGGIQLAA